MGDRHLALLLLHWRKRLMFTERPCVALIQTDSASLNPYKDL